MGNFELEPSDKLPNGVVEMDVDMPPTRPYTTSTTQTVTKRDTPMLIADK